MRTEKEKKEYLKKWRKENKYKIYIEGRLYREKNKEKIRRQQKEYQRLPERKEKAKEYVKRNKEKIREYRKLYAEKTREKIIKYRKLYRAKNRENLIAKSKVYYLNNKEKILVYGKERRKKNKHKLLAYASRYKRKRRRIDTNYKIKERLSGRMRKVLKLRGIKKEKKSIELLGCTIETWKKWLEFQFKPGMSWNNYGEWEIDHIKPLSSFNLLLVEEQKKAFHFSNTQPLWAKENAEKGAKIIPFVIKEKENQLGGFYAEQIKKTI